MSKLNKKEKKKMKQMTKETLTFRIDNEEEAMALVESYKANQSVDGYTLLKYKNDYKSKKDRKTGEIVDEWWMVEVTKGYEVI